MERRTYLIVFIALGVAQLVWLGLTWKSRGFLAALNLFLYGVLAAAIYALQPD